VRRHLSSHSKKQRETSLLELDVLTDFEKDGEGLLFHLNADLRELAGLAPKKGM
jgi:uncharacterized protein (DUF4415 family)